MDVTEEVQYVLLRKGGIDGTFGKGWPRSGWTADIGDAFRYEKVLKILGVLR